MLKYLVPFLFLPVLLNAQPLSSELFKIEGAGPWDMHEIKYMGYHQFTVIAKEISFSTETKIDTAYYCYWNAEYQIEYERNRYEAIRYEYYPNGKLKRKTLSRLSSATKQITEYSPEGIPLNNPGSNYQSTYKNGKLVRRVHYYDNDSIIRTYQYKNNHLWRVTLQPSPTFLKNVVAPCGRWFHSSEGIEYDTLERAVKKYEGPIGKDPFKHKLTNLTKYQTDSVANHAIICTEYICSPKRPEIGWIESCIVRQDYYEDQYKCDFSINGASHIQVVRTKEDMLIADGYMYMDKHSVIFYEYHFSGF